MADNMLEGTFSFEAGFAPQTPGFSHSPRYTYGLSVCTRGKRKTVYPEPWSHTSHVHGPVHVAIEGLRHVYRPPKFAIVEFCSAIFS